MTSVLFLATTQGHAAIGCRPDAVDAEHDLLVPASCYLNANIFIICNKSLWTCSFLNEEIRAVKLTCSLTNALTR